MRVSPFLVGGSLLWAFWKDAALSLVLGWGEFRFVTIGATGCILVAARVRGFG
ncbi:hypothetical protein TSUD_158090 [Trifolium subterraneum]|uniref:Uncharacterized protein n=1 Tax=Trifolium subterraneum TaxID=3900 RepID=A0A2Z6MIW4_TRISU|nr:hypothetical protein TSUD_158090 [Trifolium subterraneum]